MLSDKEADDVREIARDESYEVIKEVILALGVLAIIIMLAYMLYLSGFTDASKQIALNCTKVIA